MKLTGREKFSYGLGFCWEMEMSGMDSVGSPL